jgi:hypothetical protein
MNQQFCDESTIRAELGKICKELHSNRCVLIVHRREEIVRSLAIVHDDVPKKAANLEKWLYESAHRVYHDFTFILRRLAGRKSWANNSHEYQWEHEHQMKSIYQDEHEAVAIELFLRNTSYHSESKRKKETLKISKSLIEKDCLFRVLSLNEHCLGNLRASYEAYILLIKEGKPPRPTNEPDYDRNDEHLKKILEPISIMIACSAPVLVQDCVDTHVKHKGSVGDLLNVQLDAPGGTASITMTTDKQHLEKALRTFRLEREASQKTSDLTILAYQDPRKNKSITEIITGRFDSMVFDSSNFVCSEDLAYKILECMSPKFAMTRQRPLLFRRRKSGPEISPRKNEHSFEFSVKDIEEQIHPKDISSLLVIPFESHNTRFLLVTMVFRKRSIEENGSDFTLDDLSLGNDVLRSLSSNYQREKERLAFGKLKRMLREPLSILPTENANGDTIPRSDDEGNRLPHEYRKVNDAIHDLLKISQEATLASAVRLSFVDLKRNELALAISIDDQARDAMKNKNRGKLNEESNYAHCIRTGNKKYNFDRLDELNPFYNPALIARSEICLPVFVYGFVVGILELNHPTNKGFSQWEDFLDLICVGISSYLLLAREEIDSRLVANLGDTTRLAHLRNHVINFLEKLEGWQVEMQTQDFTKQYTESKDALIKEARETKKAVKPCAIRKVVDISFKCGTREVSLRSLCSKENLNLDSYRLTQRTSEVIDLVLDGIARNIDIHGKKNYIKTGDLFQLSYEFLVLGGQKFLKLSFLNEATSYPADTTETVARFNKQIYREPYDYHGRLHLGCYIVGRIVRDSGGDIFGEFTEERNKPMFTTHLFLPVSFGVHDA